MRASVVIVSRHRPALLRRCLTALCQQDHGSFEVIVVADPAGIAASDAFAVKRVTFDEANISAARNLGVGQAAGDVVAFIDDDAVAEPTWLSRLLGPFADPQVIAATGFVRGRNGISFQWTAAEVDHLGQDHPLDLAAVTILQGTPRRTVKTHGTNCAFRRDALVRAGGFDPAFRFFHDETDLNLRIAGQGKTAIIPDAQVHHGFAEGPHRRADRVPKSLYDIGASTALFLRRHAGRATNADRNALEQREQTRAIGHLVAGRIEPRDLRRLMASLHAGWHDGLSRPLSDLTPLTTDPSPFVPLPDTFPRQGRLLSGPQKDAEKLRAEAQELTRSGIIPTILLYGPTIRPHWHSYDPRGFWEQTGGLYGRSDRSQPLFTPWRQDARTLAEAKRIGQFRPL